jgi:hypothetical protein
VDEPFWLPLFLATRAASTRLASMGRDVQVVRSESDHLEDGTRINVGEIRWTANLGIGVALRSLYLNAFRDGKWIIVSVTTGATDGPFPEDLTELAYSLRLD